MAPWHCLTPAVPQVPIAEQLLMDAFGLYSPLGGGFEWDDDFSADSFLPRTSELLGSRPVLQASKYFSPPPPRSAEPSWPHPAPCSRFSISPADIASFSLTHLTDSDMEQGGEQGL